MAWILSDVVSLKQYVMIIKTKVFEQEKERRCANCGKLGLYQHGCYPRKADRSNHSSETLNPILIQRYFCPNCRKTCSALPECIPPHRWYMWEIQQMALLMLLAGKSLRAIAREIMPTRHTIGRRVNHFKDRLRLQKDALCHHIADLGRTSGFTDFWKTCLRHFSLAQAMRLCHVAGVRIP